MASAHDVIIRARCHCSSFDQTVSLPQDLFPLKSALCHCNSCRRVSGHLFATFAVMPLLEPEPDFFQNLVKYDSSGSLSRYFCRKCGASICNVEQGEWEFATGILEVEGGLDGKLNRGLLWISDSGDGGAVPWINDGKADGLACRKMGGRGSQDVTDGMLIALENLAENKLLGQTESLECKCHCQNVSFCIVKPDGRDDRYGAGLCACTSCSKTSGYEITSWVETVLKMLGKYTSSPGIDRYFCKECGSTIFYDKTELDTFDIGVGLLNGLEGSRVQSWLQWNQSGDDVGFSEDALDKDFVRKLSEGVRRRAKQDQ